MLIPETVSKERLQKLQKSIMVNDVDGIPHLVTFMGPTHNRIIINIHVRPQDLTNDQIKKKYSKDTDWKYFENYLTLMDSKPKNEIN